MLQLSEQEAEAYRNCPTVLDLGSGFYIFPVNVLLGSRSSINIISN